MDGRVMCAVSHNADNQLIKQLQDSESIKIRSCGVRIFIYTYDGSDLVTFLKNSKCLLYYLYMIVFNRPNVRKIVPPKTVSKVLSPIVRKLHTFQISPVE